MMAIFFMAVKLLLFLKKRTLSLNIAEKNVSLPKFNTPKVYETFRFVCLYGAFVGVCGECATIMGNFG